MRTSANESRLEELHEELEYVNWDMVRLSVSEVIGTGEAFIVLQKRDILCHKGFTDKKEREVGFLINKNLADKVEEFFSVSESVVGLTIKYYRYTFKYQLLLTKK